MVRNHNERQSWDWNPSTLIWDLRVLGSILAPVQNAVLRTLDFYSPFTETLSFQKLDAGTDRVDRIEIEYVNFLL